MNCQTCKNPILNSEPNCEWCGSVVCNSNENIDKDLCFCVLAKHFIYDGGGFSLLCHHLNLLRTEITEKNKILERSLQPPRAKRARRS